MKIISMLLKKSAFVFLLSVVVQLSVKAQTTAGSSTQSVYGNMALNKTATASTAIDSNHGAMYAFDGNKTTLFTSNYNENQWLSVDMGKSYFLSSVIITWEKSYGKDYTILFSNNGTFTDLTSDSIQIRNHIFKVSSLVNTDTILLKSNTVARYVRMQGLHSATGNGYSIWEMQVMGNSSTASLFPVSVTAFTAAQQNNGNLLEWMTATEYNNAGFSIERSSDAINFSVIGWIVARNQGTVVSNYSFADRQALPGRNYYRLKQVWQDGKTAYSAVITVNGTATISMNAYPVPAKDRVAVDYTGIAGETISISLYNVAGLPVYTSKIVLQTSQQTIVINRTGAMKPGQYYLHISSSSNKTYNEKIVLQ